MYRPASGGQGGGGGGVGGSGGNRSPQQPSGIRPGLAPGVSNAMRSGPGAVKPGSSPSTMVANRAARQQQQQMMNRSAGGPVSVASRSSSGGTVLGGSVEKLTATPGSPAPYTSGSLLFDPNASLVASTLSSIVGILGIAAVFALPRPLQAFWVMVLGVSGLVGTGTALYREWMIIGQENGKEGYKDWANVLLYCMLILYASVMTGLLFFMVWALFNIVHNRNKAREEEKRRAEARSMEMDEADIDLDDEHGGGRDLYDNDDDFDGLDDDSDDDDDVGGEMAALAHLSHKKSLLKKEKLRKKKKRKLQRLKMLSGF